MFGSDGDARRSEPSPEALCVLEQFSLAARLPSIAFSPPVRSVRRNGQYLAMSGELGRDDWWRWARV